MTDHIADRAGFLAALAKDDPERMAADAHAQFCAACRAALDEGARLVAVLGEALPLPPPTPEALASAAAAIEAETTAERQALRRVVGVTVGAFLVSWLFQLMVGGGFVMDARHLLLSLTVLALAMTGAALMWGRERVAVPLMLAVSGLLVHLAGSASGLDPGIGIRCTFRELWAACIPWGVLMLMAKREGVSLSRWNVTGVAAGGALAAHAGQHLACQVPHADAHLLVFHFAGVVVATLLGAASARRLPWVQART